VSCSVDLLIVETLEIAVKMRLRRLIFHFDSWKLPLQHAPPLIAPEIIIYEFHPALYSKKNAINPTHE